MRKSGKKIKEKTAAFRYFLYPGEIYEKNHFLFVFSSPVRPALSARRGEKPTNPSSQPLDVIAPLSGAIMPAPTQDKESQSAFEQNRPPLKSKGLILGTGHWPLSQQETAKLNRFLSPTGLRKTAEHERFQSLVFSWEKEKTEEEALKICKSLSQFLFLKSCESDTVTHPAGFLENLQEAIKTRQANLSSQSMGFWRKLWNRLRGKKQPSPPPTQRWTSSSGSRPMTSLTASEKPVNPLPMNHPYYKGPEPGPELNPPSVPETGTGSLRSCHIVPSQLGLEEGTLSDYWAQEMIGSDLLKEELKKAPPVNRHLVASFDSFYNKHNLAVQNVISGPGRQAVLPPPPAGSSQKNVETRDVSFPSMYLGQSDWQLSQVNKKCGPASYGVKKTYFKPAVPISPANCRFRRYDPYGHYVCVDRQEDVYPH